MANWIASTREPTTAKNLPDALTLYEGDRRNRALKAQLEAATKAAATIMGTFDGPALVSLSGHAADEETDLDRIHVEVARASE